MSDKTSEIKSDTGKLARRFAARVIAREITMERAIGGLVCPQISRALAAEIIEAHIDALWGQRFLR